MKFFNKVLQNLNPVQQQQTLYHKYKTHEESYHDHLDLEIAIEIRSYDDINRFLKGFIGILKEYHPYKLTEPERCYFSSIKPSNTYYQPRNQEFVFDINNPIIPRDVFDNLDNSGFTISLVDNSKKSFCFWLTHSDSNIHDIFFENDNAGKGFLLRMQVINTIVYHELVDFIFNLGFTVKGEKYV